MPILTAEERVGTVLGGRYRIESILGTGGTATVYRAIHTFTNRAVALKILKPEHGRDRGLVARFLKEARIASTVAHPNVVAILDMGTADDCTYLAMELLHGESLATKLATSGRLPHDEAIRLLRPLLEAVVVAHDKGIVHRDIKPDNVLVGDRGDGVARAVLLDFGMAKTEEAAWGHMTQSGVLVGTPYYMSPEQAEGAPDIGPATDVWSTGVMLYRALSGDLPFTATSPTALLLAIARGDHVPLSTQAPDVPQAITAWVEGAIVVDRAKRYADMRAMLAALDDALTGIVRSAPPADVSTSQVRPALGSAPTLDAVRPASGARLAVGVLALALIGALAVAWAIQPSEPAAADRTSTVARAEPAPVVVTREPAAAPVAPEAPVIVPSAPPPAPADEVPAEPPTSERRRGRARPGPASEEDRGRTRGAAERVSGARTETPSSETPSGTSSSGLLTEW